MRRIVDRYSIPEIATAAFAVVVVVILLYAASTSGTAFAAFNPTWEGTSEIQSVADESGAETTVMEDVEEYDGLDADETIVLVLEPEGGYDEDERERIHAFVERGGTVLIADASGQYSNPLLESIGASTRIDGDPLRDERHFDRSSQFPVAVATADHPYTDDIGSLTLNHGSSLEPGEATVIVQSSDYAYLDRNRNETLDPDDEFGPHPVATAEDVGEGEVIVVSDSSAFTNVMMERPGNRAFVTNVLAGPEHVVLDDSQTAETPLLIATTAAIRESAALQLLFGGGFVLALALLARRPGAVDGLYGAIDWLARTDRPPREPPTVSADDPPSLDDEEGGDT